MNDSCGRAGGACCCWGGRAQLPPAVAGAGELGEVEPEVGAEDPDVGAAPPLASAAPH